MKPKALLHAAIAAAILAGSSRTASAQEVITWTANTGDLFDAANWDLNVVPGIGHIILINNAGTATIGDVGDRSLSDVRLGDVQDDDVSGHIIMNGGFLRIGQTAGDPKAVIGFSATLSTFIMNGGTIFFDGPDLNPGNTNGKGVNELDWEVGEKGKGRFEMHNNAVFRASDDLKIAENAAGDGSCLIDGNARVSVGSGISISSGGTIEQSMVIAGNALVESGNSMGAGSPDGQTDEGYLTMAVGDGLSRLTIRENGVLNIRRLTAREGTSHITVKDHGQFHIFDVFNGKGFIDAGTPPDRPPETGPNSAYGSAASSDATLLLQDDAQMTVNSDPASGPTKGLAIGGQRDAGNAGGKAVLIVQDRASLRIQQHLQVGTGASDTSDGTVTVIGPNATVAVAGDLALAVDLDGVATPGKGTVNPVITGATHSIINVAGTAKLANGTLKVKLAGYTPVGGEIYTLIKGGTIEGEFLATDFAEATLGAGLTWKVEYAADAVRLRVQGGGVAQTKPGLPEANGLTPLGPTVYLNPPATSLNNGETESLGVAVVPNGNVAVGWEDDGDELKDQEAVWTMYDTAGNPLTPVTQITTIDPAYVGQGLEYESRFLSYFHTDGAATSGRTSWGPKIKANLFGDGWGMGATSFDLDKEVPAFAAIQNNAGGDNAGDFPSVQLLSNTGGPVGIIAGVTDEYAERDGDIRIGDWDYLSNGNLVVVGESRQRDDLINIYGGAESKTHGIVRVVTPAGAEVKAIQLLSTEPVEVQIWHGSAVTANGFAVRYAAASGTKLRFFTNAGDPVGPEVAAGDATGSPISNGGGRGEDIGFNGNGKDAYVLATAGLDENSQPQIWIAVLNADGTKRWARTLSDNTSLPHVAIGRVDAAIDASGRVAVVYADKAGTADAGGTTSLVLGRLFDAQGNPLGGVFHVSEKELPVAETLDAAGPRIDWRGSTIAVAWESKNLLVDNPDAKAVVALRSFKVEGGAVTPTIAIARETDGTLTITYTGTLLESGTVGSGYTPVANPTNPYKVNPANAAGPKFYRTSGN